VCFIAESVLHCWKCASLLKVCFIAESVLHCWKCADAVYQKLSKLVYACRNYSMANLAHFLRRSIGLVSYRLAETACCLGLLTFKQNSSSGLFWFFHYSFTYCYFLVVRLHLDYLVTTFKLSHILTNTDTHVNFLSEINVFNKILIFAWHDIAFCSESAVKHYQPTIMFTSYILYIFAVFVFSVFWKTWAC